MSWSDPAGEATATGATAAESGTLRGRLARVINLGVTPDMPPELAVALCATNLCAALFAVVSLGGMGMALGSAASPVLALAVALFLSAYLCVLFLNGSGLPDAARFGFLTVACAHCALLNLALGSQSGIRFSLIALVSYPPFAFVRAEGRKLLDRGRWRGGGGGCG